MATIVPIVEGHGEVPSLRTLVYLVLAHADIGAPVSVERPIRKPRSQLLREEELERAVQLAANICGKDGLVLVMVDADDDCAAELGPELQRRAQNASLARVAVVLPVCEYEAWLLASARSLAGSRELPPDLEPPDDPEGLRDAKGWITRQMPDNEIYRETVDQPGFTAELNVDAALTTRSFRKFYQEITDFVAEVG